MEHYETIGLRLTLILLHSLGVGSLSRSRGVLGCWGISLRGRSVLRLRGSLRSTSILRLRSVGSGSRGAVLLRSSSRRRCGGGDQDLNVSGLTNNLGLEPSNRVSGVSDSTDESIRVDDAVTSTDLVSLALLLAVLVVGELIILHVKAEVV